MWWCGRWFTLHDPALSSVEALPACCPQDQITEHSSKDKNIRFKMSQIMNTKSRFVMFAFVFILLLFLFQHIWEGKSCAMCISRVSKCIRFDQNQSKPLSKMILKHMKTMMTRFYDHLLSKGTAISPVLLTLKRLTALSDWKFCDYHKCFHNFDEIKWW